MEFCRQQPVDRCGANCIRAERPLTRQRVLTVLRCPLPQGEKARSGLPWLTRPDPPRYIAGRKGHALSSFAGEAGSTVRQTGWVRGRAANGKRPAEPGLFPLIEDLVLVADKGLRRLFLDHRVV